MQHTKTQLLARKNGDIAIVELTKTTNSYLVLKYAMESSMTKVFLAERGKRWDLFDNVVDAINWISE